MRRLGNWIDGWMDYTSDLTSPAIFRKWSAISAISAAMERKVWIISQGAELYANLYIILCAPPGVGKSTVLARIETLLGELEHLHIAPSSVTSASLVDVMGEAKRSILRPAEVIPHLEFNFVQSIASELGVFLPAYETAFMNTLTKMYDGEAYREARRNKDLRIEIKRPLLGLVGGTTPSYMASTIPEGAWDQGFLSRSILIFSGEKIVTDPFAERIKTDQQKHLYKELVHDLKVIHGLTGAISIEPEAIEAITAWNRAGCPPEPQHLKLQHYNTRRLLHLIKLTMVATIARSSELNITIEDYQCALNWLVEAEEFMPDIFKSIGLGGDGRAIEETWYFVYERYSKESEPVAEHRILSFLKERVPAHSIMRVLEIMVKTKMLDVTSLGFYKPAPKQTHH